MFQSSSGRNEGVVRYLHDRARRIIWTQDNLQKEADPLARVLKQKFYFILYPQCFWHTHARNSRHVLLTLVNIEWRVHSDLKTMMLNFLQTHPIFSLLATQGITISGLFFSCPAHYYWAINPTYYYIVAAVARSTLRRLDGDWR